MTYFSFLPVPKSYASRMYEIQGSLEVSKNKTLCVLALIGLLLSTLGVALLVKSYTPMFGEFDPSTTVEQK